jgi:hypothetical protein
VGSNEGYMVFSILFGFALICLGVYSVIRKRFSWRVSDHAGSRILFTLTLTQARAILFGILAILGGLITIIPLLVAWLSHNDLTTDDSIRTLATLVGLLVVCLGFFISCFFEFLQHLRNIAAQKSNKDRA